MDEKMCKSFKTFLTIAGSDCIGGAGIQADIKTAQCFDRYSASAVTCITSQNSKGVNAIVKVADKTLTRQLESVSADFTPDCIKIGMLCDASAVETVGRYLDTYPHGPVVCDTVLGPTKGHRYSRQQDLAKAIVRFMAGKVDVITPNISELKALALACNADMHVIQAFHHHDIDYMAGVVLENGFPNLLVTGSETACDVLYTEAGKTEFKLDAVETPNHHGTGCVFSSALACSLADGHELTEAIRIAKEYVNESLFRYRNLTFGSGYGPANFFVSCEESC